MLFNSMNVIRFFLLIFFQKLLSVDKILFQNNMVIVLNKKKTESQEGNSAFCLLAQIKSLFIKGCFELFCRRSNVLFLFECKAQHHSIVTICQ